MRKKFIVRILFLSIVSFCAAQSPMFAQPAKSKAIYDVPRVLKLNNNSSAEPSGLITEEIYPIGWSKDGKFAFYTEPPDEACGCYFGNLYIQDMRTDKLVWSDEYDGDESRPDENIKAHWRRNQKLFDRKLAEHGIVQNKKFALQTSPFEAAGDSVKPDFFSDVKLVEESTEFRTVGNVFVKLISNRQGAKTVYQKNYAGKSYDDLIKIELGGATVCPFESRIAVFLVETRRGWEGLPYVTHLRVIGASLTTNFR